MIDLDLLPPELGLPKETAEVLGHRAAIALQRRHRPGVRLRATVAGETVEEELRWRERNASIENYEDINRVTEEGAEAIALALARTHRSWRVRRRLQSRLGEGADWLLIEPTSGAKIILEVGGTDEQDLSRLLARKIDQVKCSPFSSRGRRAACVVRFLEPSAKLWSDHGPR